MIFVFYFFAAVLILLGWKSLRGGIAYLEFFQTEIAKPKSEFTPFVSIIAPCRGLDEDLEANLAALFNQNFPRYEIVFVVGDEQDESVSAIKKVIQRGDAERRREEIKPQININKRGLEQDTKNLLFKNSASPRLCAEKNVFAKITVAGKTIDSSQKVHNLRQAVLETVPHSEIFVFVDSDARPDANWLRNLIAPLQDINVGAATGYRWFVSKRGNFASELRSVWNASIASALGGDEKSNFCWGGSMAIRRETFEKLDLRERLRGTLSDDYTFTRALREADLPIRFVPQALTATVEDCSFGQLLEFTTRQMKITRVYAPHLWKLSFVGSFLFSTIFWTGFALLFFLTGWQFWLTLLFLLTIFAFGAGKAHLRLKAVRLVLKDYESQLKRSFPWQTTLWTITPILFFLNDFSALLSRRILWRGIRYELKSPRETVIISDDAE